MPTFFKGPVGIEDLKLGNGTFLRRNSLSGYAQYSEINWSNLFPDSNITIPDLDIVTLVKFLNKDYNNSFTTALTSIGSTIKTTLIIDSSPTNIPDCVVTDNIELWFINGNKLQPANNSTITFIGNKSLSVSDEAYIFDISAGGSIKDLKYATPQWFGAKSDGTDASTTANALEAALASIIDNNGIVLVPAGKYAYNKLFWDITNVCTLIGAGVRQTYFLPSNCTDWAIKINHTARNNGMQISDDTLNTDESTSGVRIGGFSIIGDRSVDASGTNGICTYDVVDDLHMHDIHLLFLNGIALSLGVEGTGATGRDGVVRESQFDRIMIRSCGDSTYYPLHISTAPNAGDSTNQLTFNDCSLVYNYNKALIDNEKAVGDTRRLRFINLMLHGWHTNANAPAYDLLEINGKVRDVRFIGGKFNGSSIVDGTNYSCIKLDDDASGNKPTDIVIDADFTSCEGDGIHITVAGRIQILGSTYYFNPATHYFAKFAASSLANLANGAVVKTFGNAISIDIDSTVIDYIHLDLPNYEYKDIFDNHIVGVI